MEKAKINIEQNGLSVEDYQKLVENLRVRLNVLNASIFLLEEKLISTDLSTNNYLKKINTELETIRKMILPYPLQGFPKN